MAYQQLLDPLPSVGFFLVFALVALVAYEVGFRAGRWWQERTPDEKEGPTGMLVGSLLALMAFLLAVTMSMASERFDARRQDVLLEANAIGTVYLRAGYLPQPAADETRELLREYAPLRIDVADRAQVVANFERSDQIQNELWAIAEPFARGAPRIADAGALLPRFAERPDRPGRDQAQRRRLRAGAPRRSSCCCSSVRR